MLRRYKPRTFTKVVADADTPELLGAGTLRMFGVSFIGQKAIGVDNATDVIIKAGGQDALVIPPGGQIGWPQPPYEAGYLQADDFTVEVETDGDGIRCVYNDLGQ